MGIAEHDNITQATGQHLSALVERQRSQFRAEGEVTYATRIDRLKRLKALIIGFRFSFFGRLKQMSQCR